MKKLSEGDARLAKQESSRVHVCWQAYQDRLAQLFARGSDLDIKARTELASLVGAKVPLPRHYCKLPLFCT